MSGTLETGHLAIDADRLHVDRICDEFERRWSSGERPRIEDVLPDGPRTPVEMRELLLLEIELRRVAGDAPRAAEYRERFPQQRVLVDDVFSCGPASTLATGDGESAQTISVFPIPGATSESSPETTPASALPGYTILGELGRGGMGVVYKARQDRLDRVVALKTIRSGELASPEEVKRFLSEANSAARLDHPNIVPIHEIGERGGLHYFSMGFVEGRTLQAVLADGVLPPHDAAQLVLTLAEAVHYAHESGVIHRDLKPGNVLLDAHGDPRITDFGLAKQIETDSALTATGQVLGTPSYMPPEQATGDNSRIGPHSDVYSLGAILYALLTGRPPFQAANVVETLKQVVERDPVSPRQLNPEVGRDLETICLKCLDKEAAKRYASAAALADDLGRCLRREPISARSIGRVEKVWRWCRRNPARAFSAVALLFAIAAFAAFGARYSYSQQLEDALDRETKAKSFAESERLRAVTARQAEEQQRKKAESAQAEAERLKDERDELLYYRNVNLALAEWSRNNPARARQLLAECPTERRQWEWHYAYRVCHPELLSLRHGQSVSRVAISNDGTRIAITWRVSTRQPQIKILNIRSGEHIQTIDVGRISAACLAYSPDDRWIVSGHRNGMVKVWSSESGRLKTTFKGYAGPINCVAVSPDGITIAAGMSQLVKLWNLKSGELRANLPGHESEVSCIAFSQDGRRLISGGYPFHVNVWDTGTGKLLKTLRRSEGKVGPKRISGIAYLPDNKRFVIALEEKIEIVDAEDYRLLAKIRSSAGDVSRIACSPDSRWVYTSHADRTIRVWDSGTGASVRTIRGHVESIQDLAITPDGRFLVSTSRTNLKVWGAESERHEKTLQGIWGWDLEFANGGAHIVSTGAGTSIWDAQTGRLLHKLGNRGSFHPCMCRSPDSERIVVAVSREDRTVSLTVLDAGSGRKLLEIPSKTRLPANAIKCIAYSPDGYRIVTGGDDRVLRVWDSATGELMWSQSHPQPIGFVTFTSNSLSIAAAVRVRSNPSVFVWDAKSGEKVAQWHPGHVECLTCMHDDRHILVGVSGTGVGIYEAISGRMVLALKTYDNKSNDVAVSPDGRRIAVAGVNGLRLFNARNGLETISFPSATHVLAVRFSPDGQRIATTDKDMTIRIRDARSGKW